MTSRWLKLGIVGRAHGLRGSFFVSARDEKIADSVKTIRIGPDPDKSKDIKIEQRIWQSGRPALACDGISDRTAAEKLTGQPIWTEALQIVVDDASEYLLSDLIGRSVVCNDAKVLGVVEEVYESPSGAVNLIVFSREKNADVEVSMVPTYVDMTFSRGSKELNLVVPSDTFDEIWNDRGGKS